MYQAILDNEAHVKDIKFLTTLAGYVHWQITGEKVLGIGDASGMLPIDPTTHNYSAEMVAKFDKLIATIRSREISASIILQSQSQLKTIYKDAADTIVGNCDCTLFLGGKEKSTLKELSEILGKETIDLYNTSETRSTNNSYGLNYQKTGKQLMSEDEIAVMDGGKCILQLRGVRPFLSDKYDITKHPKYKMLSDYDKRNAFDIEKYRSHKLVVKPTQTFDLYDMGEVEAD